MVILTLFILQVEWNQIMMLVSYALKNTYRQESSSFYDTDGMINKNIIINIVLGLKYYTTLPIL